MASKEHMKYRLVIFAIILACIIVPTIVEQIYWINHPPLGELSGLPVAIILIPAGMLTYIVGTLLSAILMILKFKNNRYYFYAHLVPSLLFVAFAVFATVQILSA